MKWWEYLKDEDGKPFKEEDHLYVDILKDELDADLVTDFYCYYDWLFWDANSDWEIEKVEEVEIWNWREFNCGRWREFYRMHGYGERLHV
jgi:hypothetical protein